MQQPLQSKAEDSFCQGYQTTFYHFHHQKRLKCDVLEDSSYESKDRFISVRCMLMFEVNQITKHKPSCLICFSFLC